MIDAALAERERQLAERIVMAMYFPHGVRNMDESAYAREQAIMVQGMLAEALAVCANEALEAYKASLDHPELEDFAKGTVIEAQHQRQRWGDEHDTQKEPEEWFWLVGYLAGKGLQSQRKGDMEKFKHHLITGAAVLANWHARALKAEG